ncbi:holliday junction-specific endonuclease [Listeria seeligeri FSL S4-171]|uniref:Holliday junction-specific endonuclease n=1 Tax=Listeria seeligeri FSL N1-067 TaxID=702453 RepID=E3ZS75_LISSE|nr:holliday junction-specific endonuclease [Listeria seeligeri FSL N1-067]EFS02611.1 holliday junction-specific endonuclease [Listeria seeligeri FSL S4-171]
MNFVIEKAVSLLLTHFSLVKETYLENFWRFVKYANRYSKMV